MEDIITLDDLVGKTIRSIELLLDTWHMSFRDRLRLVFTDGTEIVFASSVADDCCGNSEIEIESKVIIV